MSRPPAWVAAAGRTVLDALPVGVARTLRGWLGRPGPRPVRLDDLDAELAKVAEAFATSEDEARSLLASFRLEPPAGRPRRPILRRVPDLDLGSVSTDLGTVRLHDRQ